MTQRSPLELIRYFAKNFVIVLGVVLIWRGIWYLLDMLDSWVFGGSHVVTAIGEIILGLALLFFPDRDLKEIGKL